MSGLIVASPAYAFRKHHRRINGWVVDKWRVCSDGAKLQISAVGEKAVVVSAGTDDASVFTGDLLWTVKYSLLDPHTYRMTSIPQQKRNKEGVFDLTSRDEVLGPYEADFPGSPNDQKNAPYYDTGFSPDSQASLILKWKHPVELGKVVTVAVQRPDGANARLDTSGPLGTNRATNPSSVKFSVTCRQ